MTLSPREPDAFRFERAARAFITSCAGQLARESVYQGWLTAFLCSEFGWNRVYREVHVQAADLLAEVPDWPLVQTFALREGATKGALCTDVAISRGPEIDVRSSFLRPEPIRGATMTGLLSVVAEVKVVSTAMDAAAKRAAIRRDIAKLGLYAAAGKATAPKDPALAAFMVVLDTCESHGPRPDWMFDRQAVGAFLADLEREWRGGLPAPVMMIGGCRNGKVKIDMYREFRFAAG